MIRFGLFAPAFGFTLYKAETVLCLLALGLFCYALAFILHDTGDTVSERR